MSPAPAKWDRMSLERQIAAVRELVQVGQAPSTIAFKLKAPRKDVDRLAALVRREEQARFVSEKPATSSQPVTAPERATSSPSAPDPSSNRVEIDPPPPIEPAVEDLTLAAPPASRAMIEQIEWTAMSSRQKEDAVLVLVKDGLSASQIRFRLRATSRSAVLGVVNRARTAGRLPASQGRTKAAVKSRPPKPARKPSKTLAVLPGGKATTNQFDFKQRAADRAAATGLAPHLVSGDARRPLADFTIPQSRHLTLLQLTDLTCRWPNGDPLTEGFSFCGTDARQDGPYCTYHARIAYQPAEMRRRAR